MLCCETDRPQNEGVDEKSRGSPEREKKDKKDKKDKKKKDKKSKKEKRERGDDGESPPRRSLHDIEKVKFKERNRFEPIVTDDDEPEE